MVPIQWRLLVVGFILLICGEPAAGGTYADPSGFSFTYPDDWVPVTRAAMGDANQALPNGLKKWIADNNVDLNRVAVMLIRNGREEFLENLNVVVNKQQIPVDDKTVKQLTSMLPQQYGAMGAKVDNVQGRVQKVGSHDAVVVEYQTRMPGVPFALRQRQVMIPGGGMTYIVTCTARADSFALYQPAFDRILASFQVPAPVARGFDWNRVVMMGVVGGVVGGVIAGLMVIVKRFSRKAKPEGRSDSAPGAGQL